MPYGGAARRGAAGKKSRGFKKRRKISFEKRVERVILKNAELKYVDKVFTALPIAQTGSNQGNVQLIVQNDTASGRNGRRVQAKKWYLRMQLDLPTTAIPTNQSDVVRLMMVQFKTTDGATIGGGDLLKQNTHLGFNNLENKGSFRTLVDKMYDLNPGLVTESIGGSPTYWVTDEFYLDLDIPLEWNNTTGAISEMLVNSLQIVMWSATGNAVFNGHSRVRYLDL